MRNILFLCLFILLFPKTSFAQTNSKTVDFYYAIGCQYCELEEQFLNQLISEDSNIQINRYEIARNFDNARALNEKLKKREVDTQSIPVTFVGEQIIIGFDNEKTPEIIRKALDNPSEKKVTYGSTCESDILEQCKVENNEIKVPFFGKINPQKVSLPVLTVALGLADGFNPCAMWALIALLGILVGLKSRKKLIIIGGLFLLFSYLIYVVFMAAWLNIFLLIGYIRWVQIVVGAIAIVVGINYFRDFLRTDPATCKIVAPGKKNNIIERIKKVVAHDWLLVSIIGVAMLAIAVNTIEALCSVGIPAVYTKTLAQAGINKYQSAGYIGAYNIFYMLDDLIIFTIAVFSKEIIHLSPKYRYWGILVGSIILLILGLVFIIKPELLSLK